MSSGCSPKFQPPSSINNMSVRKLSPTANLLRTSRLFSMPPPLPRPITESDVTATYGSDTATLPYPIHAAIETTEPALGRGDWGLKRQLPLRSTTRTSTPHIYIKNLDSIDHITDFGSAADHTRTLEKWQEMDLSFSKSGQNVTAPLKSVFDSDYDNTQTKAGSWNHERWRFQGPWLPGQTHGEFTGYVHKKVKERRLEFRGFLRDVRARALTATRRRELIESGEDQEILGQLDDDRIEVSDEELEKYIKQLRKDPLRLNRYIEVFLDLPREFRGPRASSVYEALEHRGPLSTHPSAGLSYLRSHSHTVNHPLYGPQENKPPVQARVLHPQVDSSGYKRSYAILGIGGVATSDGKRTFDKQDEKDGVKNFDPDIEGGGKLYVHLRKASISPAGHIELGNQRAETNALYALGVQEINLPRAAAASARDRSMPDLTQRNVRTRNRQSYGLENLGDVKKSERPLPLSEGTNMQEILRSAMKVNKPNNH